MAARGKLIDRNWKRTVKPLNNTINNNTSQNSQTPVTNGSAGVEVLPATIDDISVFVIPILSYKHEYLAWKAEKLAKSQQQPQQQQAAGSAAGQATDFDINKFEEEMDRAQFGQGDEAGPGSSSGASASSSSSQNGSVEEGVEAIAHQEEESSGGADSSSQEALVVDQAATNMDEDDAVEH